MSLILNKYKKKRRLGKGAYGEVILCVDSQGKQVAIKMIDKKQLKNDPYLQEYLEGEKQVMMSVKSQYIMELYAFEEDDNYKYFLCQYCDGGDLTNLQSKLEDKVFTLKQATMILSQVIKGLELLHRKGYLHRDIKPQNILVKKKNQQSKYFYKLADFGFCKKMQETDGTLLGTFQYMSPQILNQQYSYEVDMWAFGVLFYFMLNLETPFVLNPHYSYQKQKEQLIKQADNFSYSQYVKNSKKKKIINCTPQMQDLFKRIFEVDGSKRINFVQIREHPVFKEHFPTIQHQSRILYKDKKIDRYESFLQRKSSQAQSPPLILPRFSQKKYQRSNFEEQNGILYAQLDKINFLNQAVEQICSQLVFIHNAERLAFKYNVIKYYIILLREFLVQLKFGILSQKHPQRQWGPFLESSQFMAIKEKTKQKLSFAQIRLSQCYIQCRQCMAIIKKTNPNFESCFESEVTQKQLQGPFKQCYRTSTNSMFQKALQKVKQQEGNSNRYAYLACLIVIIHAFNQIQQSAQDELCELFSPFASDRKVAKPIMFSQIKSWLAVSQKSKVKLVIKHVISEFFS